MDSPISSAIISIHPKYVNLLSTGEKKIEFRKRDFSININKIVVYSTSPVCKIIGYFDIDKIEISTPQILWNNYADIGGIDKKDFFAYYDSVKEAVGIKVKHFVNFKKGIELSAIKIAPPQSFRYLSDKEFAMIKKLGNIKKT